MTPSEQPAVAGMPEGIDLVRIGVAGDEDFELVGTFIYKGTRPGAASGVIVRPAKGFTFQPLQSFDIKAFKLVDGPPNTFMVVKQMEIPTMITATVKVAVANSFEQKIVENTLDALKGLPGFLSLDR